MKSSTYYFYMKTEILADFQISICVPLIISDMSPPNSRKFRLKLKFLNFERLLQSQKFVNLSTPGIFLDQRASFTVKNLLWSLEFAIIYNLEQRTIKSQT